MLYSKEKICLEEGCSNYLNGITTITLPTNDGLSKKIKVILFFDDSQT